MRTKAVIGLAVLAGLAAIGALFFLGLRVENARKAQLTIARIEADVDAVKGMPWSADPAYDGSPLAVADEMHAKEDSALRAFAALPGPPPRTAETETALVSYFTTNEQILTLVEGHLQLYAMPALRTAVQQQKLADRYLAADSAYFQGRARRALLTAVIGSAAVIAALVAAFSVFFLRLARARRRLHSSERQYRMLFDANPSPMWVYDSETHAFLAVNTAALEIYGYSQHEFLSMTIEDIRPQEELQRLADSIREREGAGRHAAGTFRHLRKDRTPIDVEITSDEIRFQGRPARVVLASDVTARVEAERALRESEERYRDLIENAGDMIATVDLNERFTSVNSAFVRALGFEAAEEIVGRSLGEFVPEERVGALKQELRDKLSGDKSVTTYEHELLGKDGRRVLVEVSSRLIHRDGEPVGVQAICRDVTARRTLEDRLRQSERLESLGRLAGGVAHDFNNLLTAINGYGEIALAHLAGREEDAAACVLEMRQAGERAAELTEQLLAFSRNHIIQSVVVDLNENVAELRPLLERVLGDDIALTVALAPDLARIEGDRGQLSQIVVNLAVNARDAMPSGGRLEIATRNVQFDHESAPPDLEPGRYVVVSVTDTGVGMDAETRTHVFEPFFTTKKEGEGTGLGLATVHGIVQRLGGVVTVYSEPGHGSTFNVYLPAVEGRPTEGAPVEDEPRGGNEQVLLVEDNASVRRLLERALASHGYAVLSAASPREAVALSESFDGRIQLLVTDVVMPEMNGGELAKTLVEQRPGLRVLYISGFTGDAITRRGVVDSGAMFLQKPFAPSELARTARAVLDAA
jgi:two-component system, cell cycle sensor histidine kinase and response regulator CckA